jgi:hypothetical protein
MKFMAVLAFGAVVLLVIVVLSPFALAQEFRRPADESLPPWMGTALGRRGRLVLIAALLFAAIGGLATLANLTGP